LGIGWINYPTDKRNSTASPSNFSRVVEDKMRKMVVGVYCIENVVNNKKYIGKSIDIFLRFSQHKKDLIENRHFNAHLQYSFNKYGIKNFIFYIIEECGKDVFGEREKYYVKMYKTKNPEYGYNKTDGGEGICGYRHTEESKKKTSVSNGGKIRTEEFKKAIAERQRGRIQSEQQKENTSRAMIKRGQVGILEKTKSRKTSIYLGVSRKKTRRKFSSQITYRMCVFDLGNYYDEIDAAKAYDSAAFFIYGEKARLNFPEDYK
jgi:group I intron endonuclease